MKHFSKPPRFVFDIGLQTKEIVVLLYLCSCANNHTCECYPSVGTIADKCSMGKTATREALHSLEEKGLIKIHPWAFEDKRTGKNRQTNNHYTVLCMKDGYQKTNPPTSYNGGEITILNTTISDKKSCVGFSSKCSDEYDFTGLMTKCINPFLISADDEDMPYLHHIVKALQNLWLFNGVVVVDDKDYTQLERRSMMRNNLSSDLVGKAIKCFSKEPLNLEVNMSRLLAMMI